MGKFGIGARVRDEDGDEGVIVAKEKGRRRVDYDDFGLCWVSKDYLTPIAANDDTPAPAVQEQGGPAEVKFKVGDRVKIVRESEPCFGMTGRVYAANRRDSGKGCDLDVQIDGWADGHCGDAGDDSSDHWYLMDRDVVLAPEWQPKVGDRVLLIKDGRSTTGAIGKQATIESWHDGTFVNNGEYLLKIDPPVDYDTLAVTKEYTRATIDCFEPLPVAAEAQGADAGGGFKAGDRIRLVKSPLDGMPLGSEYTAVARTSGNAGSVHFKDGNGDYVTWRPGDYFELVQPLTIEPGKYYRTRDGRKVGPAKVARFPSDLCGWSLGELYLYQDNGTCAGGDMPTCDLVAEWVDEPVAVAPAAAAATPAEPEPKFKVGDRVRWLKASNCWQDAIVTKIDDTGPWPVDARDPKVGVGSFSIDELELALPPSFIVCKLTATGSPLPNKRPRVHATRHAATQEAERLTGIYGGKFAVYERV